MQKGSALVVAAALFLAVAGCGTNHRPGAAPRSANTLARNQSPRLDNLAQEREKQLEARLHLPFPAGAHVYAVDSYQIMDGNVAHAYPATATIRRDSKGLYVTDDGVADRYAASSVVTTLPRSISVLVYAGEKPPAIVFSSAAHRIH